MYFRSLSNFTCTVNCYFHTFLFYFGRWEVECESMLMTVPATAANTLYIAVINFNVMLSSTGTLSQCVGCG